MTDTTSTPSTPSTPSTAIDRRRALVGAGALALSGGLALTPLAAAQQPSPHAIRLAPWFVETLLDVREDAAEAGRDGKRLLLYFGQDGCPYCQQLMDTTFSDTRIAAQAQRAVMAVALNLWGDREVTWSDGRTVSEKELGRLLKVQFTPSLLVLDEQARVIARLNGYYPPHRMQAALDWIERRLDAKLTLAEHLQASAPEAASPTLHPNAAFLPEPHDLAARLQRRGAKPLLVLIERPSCLGCDELHRDGLGRPEVAALLRRFDVVRLDSTARTPLVTPAGARTDARAWARELALPYAPALVFFDATRREVFRVEAYVRPFHLASALDYVASGAHRTQPSFQRYVQARAERLRGGGQAIDLWK